MKKGIGESIRSRSLKGLPARRKPVPAGEIAEIYLGGPCVGIGYYGDRELTEKAFVLNPTNGQWLESMYKTGDLVSYNGADGKLYFAGRAETQIKHQGYRIELGEIESALSRVAGVDEAVALQSTRGGLSQIVAVVASRAALDAKQIRGALDETLPRYMISSVVDVLREFPKNANGTIDRFALQERYSK